MKKDIKINVESGDHSIWVIWFGNVNLWVINNVDVEYIINDVFFAIERNVEFGENEKRPE